MNDLSIGEPCPNCGSKTTYCIFDTDQQCNVWSCETCQTVWDDAITKSPEPYNPDHPYPLIIDGSEPLPDPSWDYTQVYYRAVSIRREVEALFNTLEVDDGTPEVDQAIRDRLRQVSAQINAAMGELD
jgi:hypothetical protein